MEEFRIPEVVTDKKSTLDTSHNKGDQRLPGTVVTQITFLCVLSGAEHLVVSVHKFTVMVYDVERIVRLLLPSEPMIAAHNHPEAVLLG